MYNVYLELETFLYQNEVITKIHSFLAPLYNVSCDNKQRLIDHFASVCRRRTAETEHYFLHK